MLRRGREVERDHAQLDVPADVELLLHAILVDPDHRIGGGQLGGGRSHLRSVPHKDLSDRG